MIRSHGFAYTTLDHSSPETLKVEIYVIWPNKDQELTRFQLERSTVVIQKQGARMGWTRFGGRPSLIFASPPVKVPSTSRSLSDLASFPLSFGEQDLARPSAHGLDSDEDAESEILPWAWRVLQCGDVLNEHLWETTALRAQDGQIYERYDAGHREVSRLGPILETTGEEIPLIARESSVALDRFLESCIDLTLREGVGSGEVELAAMRDETLCFGLSLDRALTVGAPHDLAYESAGLAPFRSSRAEQGVVHVQLDGDGVVQVIDGEVRQVDFTGILKVHLDLDLVVGVVVAGWVKVPVILDGWGILRTSWRKTFL